MATVIQCEGVTGKGRGDPSGLGGDTRWDGGA